MNHGMHVVDFGQDLKPIPFIEEERRCKHKGCITLLSRYTYGEYCQTHKYVPVLEHMEKYYKSVYATKR